LQLWNTENVGGDR